MKWLPLASNEEDRPNTSSRKSITMRHAETMRDLLPRFLMVIKKTYCSAMFRDVSRNQPTFEERESMPCVALEQMLNSSVSKTPLVLDRLPAGPKGPGLMTQVMPMLMHGGREEKSITLRGYQI